MLNLTWSAWLAQVAQQQGKYMAKLVKKGLSPGMELPSGAAPFKYSHKGSLAYVGNDNAVMVSPAILSLSMKKQEFTQATG